MIRKLILPALAAALLAGCATGYQYRGGSGDYYYGSPGVEYRVYGGYGYPYGYGYGGYGYGYPYYGGGYYYYPWYRGHGHHHGGHHHGGHDGDNGGDDGDAPPERPTPPWRDLGSIGDRGKLRDLGDKLPQRREAHAPVARPSSQPRMSSPPRISPPPRISQPRSGGGESGSGSRMGEMLRRSQR